MDSVLREVFANRDLPGAYSHGFERLGKLLSRGQRATSPGQRCLAVVEYYEPILREKFDLDWHLRKNDLDALEQISGRYESLRDLLVDLAIEPPERGVRDFHDTIWERPLILSTIHSSKGLEWRNVFLIGAIDGVLPSSYTTHDDEGLEEEQRLLYVAVTRAKERLYILVHHEGRNNGIHTFNRLSRFVDAGNVRACLDEKHTASSGHGDEPAGKPIEGYAKSDLLAKLLGSVK
jgi:DNA helicase-2/ATP-dependent DNA helicase PcrA